MAQRDNESLVILPSTSRAVRTASRDVVNISYAGGIFIFNVTANASTGVEPRFFVQGKVPGTTGTYYTLAEVQGTTGASTSDGIRRIVVYPGATTAADGSTRDTLAEAVVSFPLPHVFRVGSSAGTTGNITYSASVDLIE